MLSISQVFLDILYIFRISSPTTNLSANASIWDVEIKRLSSTKVWAYAAEPRLCGIDSTRDQEHQ